ncbi:MAG: hypothetical protein IKK57_13265 [Clostridia bacterium]|nr:hypothetical protein [Clostridia bacterium]
MKHCLLCHWLLQGRRWLLIIPAAMLTLLTPLFAPVWVFLLLLSAILLLTAMCAIYRRDLMEIWTPEHLRMPAPRDGQAEIVMVDAALITRGPALLTVTQPFQGQPRLTADEGGLLLGKAMCLLHKALPRPDGAAVAQACREQLSHDPADVFATSKVLRHGTKERIASITLREDDGEATYAVGKPEDILARCAKIMDGDEHLMGTEDHARIRSAAADISSAGENVYAFCVAYGDEDATFLGLAAVGDAVDANAVHQLQALRRRGITLVIRDDETQHMDVPVLRRNLDIPDLHARPDIHLCITRPHPDRHTLPIIRHKDRSLEAPVTALWTHFSTMSLMLRRLSGLMLLCLMCCVLTGGLYSALAVTAVLTAGYLSFGSLLSARPIRAHEMVLTGLGCLFIRLLLNTAGPAVQDFAGTLLCLTASSILALTLTPPGRKTERREFIPMMIVIGVTLVLQVIRSWAVLGAALLPAAFAIVCGLILGLAFLFTWR